MKAAQKALKHGWIATGPVWIGNMIYIGLAKTGRDGVTREIAICSATGRAFKIN